MYGGKYDVVLTFRLSVFTYSCNKQIACIKTLSFLNIRGYHSLL